MSRQLKFRAWSEKQKRWLYGNELCIHFTDDGSMYHHTFTDKGIFEDKPLFEYTGLKIYDEVEVFEGDKLSFTVFDCFDNDKQYEGYVVYSGSRFMLWAKPDDENYGSDGGFDLDWVLNQDDTAEVIGNVHYQTPELLK